MKITLVRQMPSRKNVGKTLFIYAVVGTAEQIASFKASKGDNYREDRDSKQPLYMTEFFEGKENTLTVSSNGNWFVDNSELNQFKSLVQQYGIDIARGMMKQPVGSVE